MISQYIYTIAGGVVAFIVVDKLLEKFNIKGQYYFNHFLANSLIVYNTCNSMKLAYNLNSIMMIDDINNLYIVKSVIYSLHFYHLIWYFKKLRFDDYLHHILMVGISLPLTEYVGPSHIMSHCFFFTTGLPGGIDYLLLFLNRNNIIPRSIEKTINNFLNLWIRCPGCIMTSTLSLSKIITEYNNINININRIHFYSGLFIIASVYWNGIYFMNQVVIDYNKAKSTCY
jgi:hypothetical protein